MAKSKIVVTGHKLVDARLKALGPKLANKIARKALREEMKTIRAAVKAGTPVERGALQASVKLQALKRSRNKIGVQVAMYDGTGEGDRFVAAFVEYGTSETPAAGMFRKAFDAGEAAAKAGIMRRIRAGIEREA